LARFGIGVQVGFTNEESLSLFGLFLKAKIPALELADFSKCFRAFFAKPCQPIHAGVINSRGFSGI